MQGCLETDYLVVGTGAAGVAFTDALLSHCDVTVALVGRRHAPGGALPWAWRALRCGQSSKPTG